MLRDRAAVPCSRALCYRLVPAGCNSGGGAPDGDGVIAWPVPPNTPRLRSMNGLDIPWVNRYWIAAVSACLGEIDSNMREIWIEFTGPREVVFHARVVAASPETSDAVREIARDIEKFLDYEDFAEFTSRVHTERREFTHDDRVRCRWVYLAKEEK